jgi:hypothetical protein
VQHDHKREQGAKAGVPLHVQKVFLQVSSQQSVHCFVLREVGELNPCIQVSQPLVYFCLR